MKKIQKIDWTKSNILFIKENRSDEVGKGKQDELRPIIEPWLTALFQSEHLSLLLGTGITTAITKIANPAFTCRGMQRIDFSLYNDEIKKQAEISAKQYNRGNANFEDDLRISMELLKGLEILENSNANNLKLEINNKLSTLISEILKNEKAILSDDEKSEEALLYLKKFLISFASRSATRDRVNIFTTNYDRLIEYALDDAGIYVLDRFQGTINPIFRLNRIELDYHYNPPGIRGEPRYVEGVARFTKLHGSLDWKMIKNEIIREPLPFGKELTPGEILDPFSSKVIFPNSAKGIETAYFPYSELFKDLSSAICKPNSVLVTYGYGFGDSHINSIIKNMLNVPSTHLVIISFDDASGRIKDFIENENSAQYTLLIGEYLGGFENLIDYYLPKPAIDRISDRLAELYEKRGIIDSKGLKKHV